MTTQRVMAALRFAAVWGRGLVLMACIGVAGAAGPKAGSTVAPASQPAIAGGGTVRQDTQANVGTVGAETPQTEAGARDESNAAAKASAPEADSSKSGDTGGQTLKRGDHVRAAAQSNWLSWAALALGFVSLLAAAGVGLLWWNTERAAQDLQQAVQKLRDDIDRQLRQLREDRERDVAKFDDDADRSSRALIDLSARLKVLESPKQPSPFEAPAPVRPLPSEIALEQQAPGRMPAVRSDVAVHSERPVPSTQPPLRPPGASRASGPGAAPGVTIYRLLQEAADAALAETLHADAASFTEAVVSKLPAEMATRLRQQRLRIAGHNFNANMREDFSRPDFISSCGPGGTGVLLPCSSAAYAWSYVNLYDGPMESWPNIATPAECRIGPGGEVQMIKKGTLA